MYKAAILKEKEDHTFIYCTFDPPFTFAYTDTVFPYTSECSCGWYRSWKHSKPFYPEKNFYPTISGAKACWEFDHANKVDT